MKQKPREIHKSEAASMAVQCKIIRKMGARELLDVPPEVLAAYCEVHGEQGWPLRRRGSEWYVRSPMTLGRFIDRPDGGMRVVTRIRQRGPEYQWPVLGDYIVRWERRRGLARRLDCAQIAAAAELPEMFIESAIRDAREGLRAGEQFNALAARVYLIDWCRDKARVCREAGEKLDEAALWDERAKRLESEGDGRWIQ